MREDHAERRWRYCAVCAHPLIRVSIAGSDAWAHGRRQLDDDHIAIDVSYSDVQVKTRCDFCDITEGVTHVVLCGQFSMPSTGMGGTSTSVGHWAACTPCAALIERDRWSQLVTRVKQHGGPEARHLPRAFLTDLYRRVEQHKYGVLTVEEWQSRADSR